MQVHDRRKATTSVLLVLGLAVLSIAIAVWARPAPSLTDPALLEDSASVRVLGSGDSLTFLPSDPKGRGFVLYPDARLPPETYAFLGRGLAERGHVAVIARFPLGYAFLAPGRAAAAMARHPEVADWDLGGHGRGAATAAAWLRGHPGSARGLVLIAGRPGSLSDLSGSGLRVLDIATSVVGGASVAGEASARRLLPPDTRYLVIEGDERSGFGESGRGGEGGSEGADATRQSAVILEEVAAFLEGG